LTHPNVIWAITTTTDSIIPSVAVLKGLQSELPILSTVPLSDTTTTVITTTLTQRTKKK